MSKKQVRYAWITGIAFLLFIGIIASPPYQQGVNDNKYMIGAVGIQEKVILCQGSGWGFRGYTGLTLVIYKWGCLLSPQ